MFGANFIPSNSVNCSFCNSKSPASGPVITHIGAPEGKCTYHTNCVAASILHNDCPTCSCPINSRSLQQFKVEKINPDELKARYEAEVEAQRQLGRTLGQEKVDRDAKVARQAQDLLDLEDVQGRVEQTIHDEFEARRLQEQWDADDAASLALAQRLAAEDLDELPPEQPPATDELNLTPEEQAEGIVAQVEHDRGIRSCNPLSYVTRNRLIWSAVAIVFVARLLARF